MPRSFADKVMAAQARANSTLVLIMAPRLPHLPMPIQRYDDPFLPFSKAIIAATCDVVCGYLFDLAAYLAPGAAGAIALERSIAFARASGDVVTLLHGPFARGDYAAAASDSAFAVDAVTVTEEQWLDAYLGDPACGAFVVRRGEAPVIVPLPGNAGVFWEDAGVFTLLAPGGQPLRLQVAGERVLYAGRGDDYAERVRVALETLRA